MYKYLFIACLTTLSGCASLMNDNSNQIEQCNYTELDSTEFRFSSRSNIKINPRPYLTYIKDEYNYGNKDIGEYLELLNGPFKVSNTGVQGNTVNTNLVHKDSTRGRQIFTNINIGQNHYVHNINLWTEVVTPSCKKFYFTGELNPSSLKKHILKSDKISLSEKNIFEFYGNALRERIVKAEIKQLGNPGNYSINTKTIDGMNIVATIVNYELLTDSVVFTGNIQYEVGKTPKLDSQIDENVEKITPLKKVKPCVFCSTDLHVWVDVKHMALKNNRNGLKIHVSRNPDVYMFIPRVVIGSYLDALAEIKQRQTLLDTIAK